MILARHAEALYWAGRQMERVAHTSRVLDVTARNSMHFVQSRSSSEWKRILDMLGLHSAFRETKRPLDAKQVTWFVFGDPENLGSVSQSATQLRDNVRTVRDRVPVELWEEANRLHIDLERRDIELALEVEPFDMLSMVRRSCQTITGVVTEAMPRDEGYAFLQIGRMLERSSLICRLLRHGLFASSGAMDSHVLLRMSSTLQSFRRVHGYEADTQAVAHFLLASEDMPRSLIACLRQAERRIDPMLHTAPGLQSARQTLGRLRSELEYGQPEDWLSDPDAFLQNIEIELANFAESLGVSAFDPAQTTVSHAQFVRPGSDAP